MPDEAHLERKTNGVIAHQNVDGIRGFYTGHGAELSIMANEFDAREEMDTIIRHVRDRDPKVSLAALRLFRAVTRDIAVANGQFAKVSQEEIGPDGVTRRMTTTTTLMDKVQQGNDRARQLTSGNHEFYPSAKDTPTSSVPSDEADSGNVG